ncbi:MAG: class I SAM-dependent methyltransferase [Ktedonobacteraceae bacterium]
MQSAIERWHEILDARAKQMDAAYARLGRTSADFWERRAKNYHRSTKETVTSDPLFLKLRQEVTRGTTVLDVGAGTGRFALALAPFAGHVTAVEPNAAMLNYLKQDATEEGLTNVSSLHMGWQDAPTDLRADIVLCSHVLYPIWDVDTFIAKLRAATQHACYLYMRAVHFDTATSSLWKHFHGDERRSAPGYIYALDVLFEMGMYADVEIVRMPGVLHYPSLDVATEELLEQLILPDDEQTRGELRHLLEAWLIERDGAFVPPLDTQTGAIIRMHP